MNHRRAYRLASTTRAVFATMFAAILAWSTTAFAQGPTAQGASTGTGQSAAATFSPSPYKVETRLDWNRRILTVRVRLQVHTAGLRLPAGRLEAEKMLERDLPGLAKDALFALTVDSYRSIADTVADGTIDVNEFLRLSESARLREASFSRDLREFIALYEYPLLDIASVYIRQSYATRLEEPLDYMPSRAYSGLIIYAKGELPLHGENFAGRLQPCLFPRIFDESMALVLDRNSVAPEALRELGCVGYAAAIDESTIARVFGVNRTDIVITREDALRLLSRSDNREMLSRGQVLVIIDPEP
jgi:hypothetical protein